MLQVVTLLHTNFTIFQVKLFLFHHKCEFCILRMVINVSGGNAAARRGSFLPFPRAAARTRQPAQCLQSHLPEGGPDAAVPPLAAAG